MYGVNQNTPVYLALLKLLLHTSEHLFEVCDVHWPFEFHSFMSELWFGQD